MEKMSTLGSSNKDFTPNIFWSSFLNLSIMVGNSVMSKNQVLFLIGMKIKKSTFRTKLYIMVL